MLPERVALVTGASAGIGRAIVERFVEQGYAVVAIARRQKKLAELFDELSPEHKARFLAYPGDAADTATLHRAVAQCEQLFGRVPDIFVFSAGRGLTGGIVKADDQCWEELFRINSLGTLKGLRLAGETLLLNRCSSEESLITKDIVVIGSVTGRNISVFNPVYGASKFAVSAATEALRQELVPHGIRVTLIEPGIVRTEYQEVAGYDMQDFNSYEQEIGPFLSGDDIARFVAFVVQEPSHVNFGNVIVRPTRQVSP